jgi:NAD(P)-dependent dehydrogenase (short-subunit alcohol dehydrogenase family)
VSRGQAVEAALRGIGVTADFLPADLNTTESARTLARRAVEVGWGHVDILVKNVGIPPGGPTADLTDSEIDLALAINVKVPFGLVAEFAPAMAERGKGAIVNVGTMVAQFGLAGTSIYGASKADLNQLARAWAAEFGRSGVRVNSGQSGAYTYSGHCRDQRDARRTCSICARWACCFP